MTSSKDNITVQLKPRQKKVKVFEIQLETEDPEYINEEWLKVTLKEAFDGPEFHEPEGDHPPKLISISNVQKHAML